MRLDQLHIQNFRCYEDVTFDFQPGFNLVVGVNGSGKTSLLQAVAASFFNISRCLGQSEGLLSELDVRSTVLRFEDRYRFERAYPITLTATGDLLELPTWEVSQVRQGHIPNLDTAMAVYIADEINTSSSETPVELPLFAFYRANRRWISTDVSAESAIAEQPSRLAAYKNWYDASVSLKDFESWFIGKTLERLQRMSRVQSTNPFGDELDWVNAALKFALPNANGIEYDLEIRSLLVNLNDNTTLLFKNLSDGQRGMIALIADIARRMCLLNPQKGHTVLAETSGIVVIDELDIHLHPDWQRTIVSALKNAFPKIQFIAASHSPQIIGGLRPEEIMLLNNGDTSHPRVSYGLDSSRVLEEIMGVSEREPEIEALLSELFSTIEDNELEKAKTQLQALKELAPDLPEFAGAQALIRRKEILGK
ncbi:AAA family ATPase [Pseudomonas sp. LG1E9]|uniref:AAA family ATPase n=1 Tax=Pseudomonas sp. LG1E9 TaxID=2219057 RepID=UPI000DD4A86D|nr:AAA family ATPase [Pseudomonas sp. LG1E9]